MIYYPTEDGRTISIYNSIEDDTMIEGQITIEYSSDDLIRTIHMTAKDALLFAKHLEIEAETVLRN